MSKELSPESIHLNKIWDIGNNRAKEVLELTHEDTKEFSVEERYMYWRGFESGLDL